MIGENCTCDRCHEDCWPEWSVRFTVIRAGEMLEIVICDSCVGDLADMVCQFRDGEGK